MDHQEDADDDESGWTVGEPKPKKNGQWIDTETTSEMHCLKYRGILDILANIENFGWKKKIGRYKKFKWKKENKKERI